MIWLWLKVVFVFIAKLFIPPPKLKDLKIDPNDKCPSCGHRDGKLKTVPSEDIKVLVQHRCNVCGARWQEKTVLEQSGQKLVAGTILPGASE